MDDLPLPWTRKYVGYAKSASHRISSYNGDHSQSWFSVLLRSVFQYLYPDQGFQLVTHVAAFCVCSEECKLGEELLSRSAQAYYDTGTGMGVAPAGCNVSSANIEDMSARDAKRLWALAMAFRMHGEFNRNVARDMEDLPVYVEYIKSRNRRRTIPCTQDADQLAGAIRKKKEEIKSLRSLIAHIEETPIPLEEVDKAHERLHAAIKIVTNHPALEKDLALKADTDAMVSRRLAEAKAKIAARHPSSPEL